MRHLSFGQCILLLALALFAAAGMFFVLRRFFRELTDIERQRWGEHAETGTAVFRQRAGQVVAWFKAGQARRARAQQEGRKGQ